MGFFQNDAGNNDLKTALDKINTFYNVWAFNNTFTNFTDAKEKNTKTFKMAVRSAGIEVDGIISAIEQFFNGPEWQLHETMGWQYWQEVKKRIEAYR